MGGSLRRRAVGAALASICSLAAPGCSIDFVALEEAPIATLISVRSEHADDLRVTVEIGHSGPVTPVVRVGGERMPVDGPDEDGHYTSHIERVVDSLAPGLDIEVEQLPGALVAIQAPLLVRTGEASCEADGDVRLPARLDPIAGDGSRESWVMELLDGEGGVSTSARTIGSLPDPLVVPKALIDSVRRAHVAVRVVGGVQEAPYDTHFDLQTAAAWSIPNACP